MNIVYRFTRFMERLPLPQRIARALYIFIGILVALLIVQILLVNFTGLETSHASTIHTNLQRKTSAISSTPTLTPTLLPTSTPTMQPTATAAAAGVGGGVVTSKASATPIPTTAGKSQPVATPTTPPAPAPPPPPPVTLRYSFEDGSTDAWRSDFTSSLQNSTAIAQNGSHALKAVAVDPSSNPLVYINTWSQSQTPAMPTIGNTISAYVYIPTSAPDIQANVFVEDQGSTQFYAAYRTIPKGTWVYLSYTVPSSISGGVEEYGVGLQLAGDNNQTITAYIDSINW